jgi:hypothetical protein
MNGQSLHSFNVIRQPHNRFRTLRTGVRVFCSTHGLQQVVDFFSSDKGNTLALACGCRRREDVSKELNGNQ